MPDLSHEYGFPIDYAGEMAFSHAHDSAIKFLLNAFSFYTGQQATPDGPTGYQGPSGYGTRRSFDSGGWLDPGYTWAYNGTGRAEYVNAPGQDMHKVMSDIADAITKVARTNKKVEQNFVGHDWSLSEMVAAADAKSSWALSPRSDGS